MVLIVIPAYNEVQQIGRVVRGLFQHGYTHIVVVNDGSTDRTGEIARQEGAIVLRHEVNRGQGAALQTGDEYAFRQGADSVVHFDGDGQFNADDIAPTIQLLEEKNVDVVFGSRFLDTRSKVPWSKRWIILPVSRWINYVFTGVRLTDAHNGFRALNRRALERIRIAQDGMAHNSEIVRQIKEHGLQFTESPVEVTYQEYGQGVEGGLKIVWDLVSGILVKSQKSKV